MELTIWIIGNVPEFSKFPQNYAIFFPTMANRSKPVAYCGGITNSCGAFAIQHATENAI